MKYQGNRDNKTSFTGLDWYLMFKTHLPCHGCNKGSRTCCGYECQGMASSTARICCWCQWQSICHTDNKQSSNISNSLFLPQHFKVPCYSATIWWFLASVFRLCNAEVRDLQNMWYTITLQKLNKCPATAATPCNTGNIPYSLECSFSSTTHCCILSSG